MDLPELSSTPSSTQHQSTLVDAQGGPLKINLQAVELEGRPKLVRTLKNAGALVLSNAKEAAIILVDSTTESGKRLIRTWGHDASKVVLEYTWTKASVVAGRPLLEADNWGGAMTVDDGKPVTIDGVVVDEDELEVEALVTKSPLPTPRVTPLGSASHGHESTIPEHPVATRLESSTPGPSKPEPLKVQSTAVDETLSEERMVTTNDNTIPLQNLPASSAAQSIPHPQPVALFPQQSQPQNAYTYASFATQQVYPSSQPPITPMQPLSHSSFPSQAVHAPSVPHPGPPVQSLTAPMTSNSTAADGINLQNPTFATLMTMWEVMRYNPSWFGQNQLSMSHPPANLNPPAFPVQPPVTPAPSIPSRQATRKLESPGVDVSLSSSPGHLSDTATTSRKYDSVAEASDGRPKKRKCHSKPSRRTSDQRSSSTPSASRKRAPIVKPTDSPKKRLRKGKEKVILSHSSEHSEVGEISDASDSYSMRSSVSPARSRTIIARRKRGQIFLSKSGQPLQFFVQVDLHGRHAVVTNIKKNQGKIVNNITDADYLILFARSDTFQGLLNEATALGKLPILASFVADCIEEGALLDETDYILESAAKMRGLKPSRQNTFSVKVETPVSLSQQYNVAKHKRSPGAEKSKVTPLKSPTNKKPKKELKPALAKPTTEKVDDATRSRSPTPPPAASRQLFQNGKYLFTEAEDDYFLRLAKHHLFREPTMSNTALTHKLHDQLPHHTFASWMAHIDKKLKYEVDDIRKRANIAKRKRDGEVANRRLSAGFINEPMPFERHIVERNGDISSSSSHPTGHPSEEELEQRDFDTITRFFASGGGDDDDDERVWQQLEEHQPCRSAKSWPEYYAAHEKQVYSRIEELVNERAEDQGSLNV